jgi:hypothetical protein
MRFLIVPAFALSLFSSFGQGRVVINGNAYIVIDNSAKVVVENPATNAISSNASGGFVTESEFDQVIWNIGTTSGSYLMPFVSQSTFTSIPFTANFTASGVGAGRVLFSTYPGPTWDNNTYRPSDVTHMFDYNTGAVNNSDHVIDRFWIIDAQSYTTKPSATFSFSYRDIEHSVASNNIVESNLGAQRFNNTSNIWGDYLPQGTTNAALNITTGVPVTPANFFRSWTLSEITNPLAVEISYFKTACKDEGVMFNWQTLVETDVDHFEIEKMQQAGSEVIAFIPSNGGTGVQNYEYLSSIHRTGTFRLVEVTTNGERNVKSTLTADCGEIEGAWVSYVPETEGVIFQVNGESNSEETLTIIDASGKLVYSSAIILQKGLNTVSVPNLYLSSGMYVLNVSNGSSIMNEKFIKY